MTRYDTIVIGGGVNGLVAATFIARAGLKTLVLERSDRAGGCARTTELAPGFRCPTLAHTAAIDPALVGALALARHGLTIIRPDAEVCAPTPDGRALVLWRDVARAAESIRTYSAEDAAAYPRFMKSFAAIASVLRGVLGAVPPSIDGPTAADLIDLVKSGRAFRSLGRADAYRLIRWIPMGAADLTGEWFESEPLRAAIAAGGVLGSFVGPRSAGSAAVLLLLGARDGEPLGGGWLAAGGPGAIAEALVSAARQAGVDVRTNADVTSIEADDGAATGVCLASGETIGARVIVSGLDPKRTLLDLVGPMQLSPDVVRRAQNIRARGTLAKLNFAVAALPRFAGLAGASTAQPAAALSGRIRLAPDIDTIERAFDAAKYGRPSDEPWIELTIPSLSDLSLAPGGQHVVSAYAQYAPYRLRDATWDVERDSFAARATRVIERYAPGFESSIVAREIITPVDLERQYGLTGGHIFHGELALDQLFVARPLLGWSRYQTPIRNLFLCGSGTHPGTGLDGRSGALAAKEIVRTTKR